MPESAYAYVIAWSLWGANTKPPHRNLMSNENDNAKNNLRQQTSVTVLDLCHTDWPDLFRRSKSAEPRSPAVPFHGFAGAAFAHQSSQARKGGFMRLPPHLFAQRRALIGHSTCRNSNLVDLIAAGS